MLDRFERRIDYLRISVTDRCDLRCVYCMPEHGVPLKRHADILSFEQIAEVAVEAAHLGVTKVRLTGGEPLIRRGIAALVAGIAQIDGIAEVAMTTNGTRLASMAPALKAAGLDRVNISIDSLEPERYRAVTRGGGLEAALEGVDAAVAAQLTPVKINMVILRDTTGDEVHAMQAFCERKGVTLQKIMQFSLYDRQDLSNGFHAERPPKCPQCNRLRLTADGYLKPCLLSDSEVRVDFHDVRGSLLEAVAAKPQSGTGCTGRPMYGIGG